MANHRLLLLIAAFSTHLAIGICQMMEDALEDFHQASKIKFALAVRYEPEDVPLNTTIEQLRYTAEKMKAERNNSNRISFEMIDEVHQVHHQTRYFSTAIEELRIRENKINEFQEKFDEFVASLKASTEMAEIDAFFKNNIESIITIKFSLHHIYLSMLGTHSDSSDWFQLLQDYIRDSNGKMCGSEKVRLTQAHIFNYYHFFYDLEYRGSMLVITAYRHLTRRRISNYQDSIKDLKMISGTRFREYTKRAHKAMKGAPREIFNCDDKNYVKNKTYIELQGSSQGFLIGPAALGQFDKCDLHTPADDSCDTYAEECLYRKCSQVGGKVNNCFDINEDKDSSLTWLKICPSADGEKRYSWATLNETHSINNTTSTCPEALEQYMMIEKRINFSPFPKNYMGPSYKKMCFCDCERQIWKSGDIRAISYMWTQSQYWNNRVITDIRFREINGMILFEAQEGLILPGGRIDQSTLSWIDSPHLVPSTEPGENEPFYTFTNNGSFEEWFPDDEFAYFSTNLSMNFDDIVSPEDHVVVSISFGKVYLKNSNELRIGLNVAVMPYNFTTGIINEDIVQYLPESSNERTRTLLELDQPGSPIHTNELKNEISKSHTVVKFKQTDWKKDLGQSIVPFFESNPIKPAIALPLSSISLYHRGCHNCGGFIALKLVTYDLSQHFGQDHPESPRYE